MSDPKDRWKALTAGSLLTLNLGSIHAFSVFVAPFEALYDATRGHVSLIYSLALVCLTLAVLGGHKIYSMVPAHLIALMVCACAAAGLALAAVSEFMAWTVLAYSVLFGSANGIGYGFSLYIVSLAWPKRKGFAMGLVTAFYAVGAALFAQLFSGMIQLGGPRLALSAMAVWMVIVGAAATILLRGADRGFEVQFAHPGAPLDRGPRDLRLLWIGYGTGVAAGLMAIAHAVGILRALQASQALAVSGAVCIAAGNALGGVLAGWQADRMPIRRLLMALPGVSTIALLVLAGSESALVALAALTLVGFGYGAIIAVYPMAVAVYYGPSQAARIYGRIFTAWGTAGLLAPWLAGLMFDSTGGYLIALVSAAVVALVSSASVAMLPKDDSRPRP